MSGAPIRPSVAEVLRHPVQWLATGLGSGLLRPAPGTWGSLAALALHVGLLSSLPQVAVLALILVGAVLGVWICGLTARQWGVHDHDAIVWDEWIGQWIALLWMPYHPVAWILAFIAFRWFDIRKPWLIGVADRKLQGGLGIMMDDVLAGLAALAAGHLVLWGLALAGWPLMSLAQ